MTVLRTGERLALELNHVPLGQLGNHHPGRVQGVSIGCTGQMGDALRIMSIGVQKNPLAPDRIPEAMRTYLTFLRDALLAESPVTSQIW